MASVLSDHIPIRAVKTVSGNSAQTRSIAEQLSQTFFSGVPVMLNSGVIKEWDANATATAPSATVGIAGVAAGFAGAAVAPVWANTGRAKAESRVATMMDVDFMMVFL